MGLAAPRKRQKLGHDPNNTTWTRSTDSYGSKILAAQGWTPGSFLGAQNAPQAEHYSAANASHIRVAMRVDNAGLGAHTGGFGAENFGSGVFSDILGRLNGKTEEQIGSEQRKRTDLGRKRFVEQKYGATRFVRGGLLVGDNIEVSKTSDALEQSQQPRETAEKALRDPHEIVSDETVAQANRSNTTVHASIDNAAATSDKDELSSKKEKKAKREKKVKKSRRTKLTTPEEQRSRSPAPVMAEKSYVADDRDLPPILPEPQDYASDSERRRRKLEKKAKKEARRREKADKEASTSTGKSELETSRAVSVLNPSDVEHSVNEAATAKASRVAPLVPGSRHHVRQRYIQQKRMASMNAQSLREILMVRS